MVKDSKNNKTKKLFTLQWTKNYKTDVTMRGLVIFLTISILLLVGWFSKVIPFGVGAVKCLGLPVESYSWSRTYKLPGDKTYGINIVYSEYQFCNSDDAEEAGYNRSEF